MDKNTIIVIAMVVLFLFAAVQTVQLTSIKKQLAEGDVSLGTGSVGASTSSASSSNSLDSLPTMVGGC
ncbi:hypothetical protein COV16_05275 [Candidatus Woesearchaeota archaeon CG10_big_fil_rev_8_21_14_0_10_34_8]|nr:MAG: hypothetical protein COV16_05275 [Candidatus Woesearchaeota archaeon CG10_big_fil_rev_8_21_14_0_10_34_8]